MSSREWNGALRTAQAPRIGATGGMPALDELLAAGGDTRLHLDPTARLNSYGCRPFPRPEAFTFASSTATSISERAYGAAGATHQMLVESAFKSSDQVFDDEVDAVRQALLSMLGLQATGHDIAFSPSGTDSELHAVFIARRVLRGPLTCVIAGSDETGSGTTLAALGRHFSTITSQRVPVAKGEPITGMGEDIESVGVPLRAADGALRALADIDADVSAAVAASIERGRDVLLHVMDHSKLGWRCPTIECIDALGAKWSGRILVVVDACQMRLSRPWMRAYLEHGFLVQITGSKFFTGPPFSGALLVPEALCTRLRRMDGVPPGLRDYSTRSDWPLDWSGVRDALPETTNVGQLLRWTAAAREIGDYFAVPPAYRQRALAYFSARLPQLIDMHASLKLLPDGPHPVWNGIDNEELAVRTIFPFLMRRNGQRMPLAECTTVYRALNHDLSALLPSAAGIAERELGAQLCHIGQPVAVREPDGNVTGALRISAGARVVSETWLANSDTATDTRLEAEIDQVRTILEKIQLILRHFDALHGKF